MTASGGGAAGAAAGEPRSASGGAAPQADGLPSGPAATQVPTPGDGAPGNAAVQPGSTRTTLVFGGRALLREAAIAAQLAATATNANAATTALAGADAVSAAIAAAASSVPSVPAVAVILEGLADGNSDLVSSPDTGLHVQRIAPGCLCCAGNLVLRVTLNRLLRRPPAQLYISLANAEHVEQLRSMLLEAPYGNLLDLAADLQLAP